MAKPTEQQKSGVPIWGREEPGSRRPAYTREKIAEAAIALADAEGYGAVSMRRIASELGGATMTLYHYVRNKEELLVLISDTIMNEIVVPAEELPDGWREGTAALARRTLAVLQRHPWLIKRAVDGGPYGTGPGFLRSVEQALSVAARSGLDVDRQCELAAIVDDYVFGYAMRRYDHAEWDSQREQQSRRDGMDGYLSDQLATGAYPHIELITDDDPVSGFARIESLMSAEQRFERGLERVLDGLELWVRQLAAEQAANEPSTPKSS